MVGIGLCDEVRYVMGKWDQNHEKSKKRVHWLYENGTKPNRIPRKGPLSTILMYSTPKKTPQNLIKKRIARN
jgi:hypothetical protein